MQHVFSALRPALAAAALLLALGTAPASAGRIPPDRITVNAPIHAVYCALGCCCGQVDAWVNGHYYDAGALGYCRWFRGLHDGQVVRVTLRLAR